MNVNRNSLISGLSYALDIAGKNNLSHSKSTAYLSVMLANEIGFNEGDILSIYYTALLHDIGVSDEFLLGQKYALDMKRHCIIGSEMLEKLPLPPGIPENVLYHHEYYDGSGQFGLSGEAIPKGAQIVGFSSVFDDVFGKMNFFDRDLFAKITNWIDHSRSLYSGEIVDAFSVLTEREYFLLEYFNLETKYTLTNKLIFHDNVYLNGEDIKKFALCFADIIDQRSPFTFHHSTGIASLAEKAAAYLGYDEEVQYKMYIAGLLHDIGKLDVLPDILNKEGQLTPEERFEINKHTYFTRKILEQIQGFEEITNIAANHHEKLDGSGYPYRLTDTQLTELEKLMAICDVYQALTEERPYRASMSFEKAWGIIEDMVKRKLLDEPLSEKMKHMLRHD